MNLFDFLGYAFRRRLAKSKNGNFFQTFSPAVSKSSAKSFRDKIKKIRLNCKTLSLEEYAREINPVVRGWMNYFMKFGSGEARKQIDYVNVSMVWWLIRKYKRIKRSKGKAWRMLARLSKAQPELFYHWTMGIRPTIG
ncbi:MAG: group II intron maturase-specific domain-containing protein [Candidatus Theseobacter exili]|nr:group II intron maturase-specific domain-containing protein [Candidatus Theseobacter exili]